jgi:hypothetical protein
LKQISEDKPSPTCTPSQIHHPATFPAKYGNKTIKATNGIKLSTLIGKAIRAKTKFEVH